MQDIPFPFIYGPWFYKYTLSLNLVLPSDTRHNPIYS